MKRWLSSGGIILACGVCFLMGGCPPVGEEEPPPGREVFTAAPGFNPAAGTYGGPVMVQIYCATDGARIYFTLDGTTPSEATGQLYATPIPIGQTTAIKAIAYSDLLPASTVTEGLFVIQDTGAPLVASVSVTGNLRQNELGVITVSCMATDSDGQVVSVVADLLAIGGSAVQELRPGTGNLWTWSGPVTPTGSGTKTIRIRARDDDGRLAEATLSVTVAGPVGSKLWSVLTQGVVQSSPAVGPDGTVYVGATDRRLYAVSPDGDVNWTARTDYLLYSSPVIAADGTIHIGGTGGSLYAFTPDGTAQWEFRAGGGIFDTSAIGVRGWIVVGDVTGKVYSLNGDSGTKRWEFATGGAVEASPTIGGDATIYIGSKNGVLYALYPSGVRKWTFTTGGPIVSSAAVGADGTIYFGSDDGRLYALKPDGTRKWDFLAGAAVQSSPATGPDGTIYVGCNNGKVYAIGSDGICKWELITGGAVYSSPAVGVDGVVYVGSANGKVYAINGQDGSIAWEYQTGGPVTSSPALGADGTVYVGSADKYLYAIRGSARLSGGASWGMFRGNTRHTGAVAGLPMSNMSPLLGNLSVSATLYKNESSNVTISCTAVDPDGAVSLVVADASAIGGSGQQALAAGAGGARTWSGSVTPASVGVQTIRVTVTDDEGAQATATTTISVANRPPAVSNAAVTGALKQLVPSAITVSCTAADAGGEALVSVVADLSAVGGSAAQALALAGNNVWSWSGTLTAPLAGTMSVAITAQDADGATTSATVNVDVVNEAPVVTNVVLAGDLRQNQICPASVTCTVVDPEGALVSVVADLSGLGGPGAVALAAIGGNSWRWTGSLTPPTNGPVAFSVVATDVVGVTAMGTGLAYVSPELKWGFATGDYVDSSPAVGTDGTVYVGSVDGNLYAIKPDGTEKWRYPTAGGVVSSPTISADGSVIYVGSFDRYLYAINADGTLKWRFATGGYVDSSPALAADGTIYIASHDKRLYAVNPANGSEKWRFTAGNSIFSSPAVEKTAGVIYFGSYDGNVYAVNPADGSQKWAFPTGAAVMSSPAIGADGTVYIGSIDMKLYAIKPDGTAKWAAPFATGGYVYSSPAIALDGTIYVGSMDNKVYAVNPEGTKKWDLPTGGWVRSSPALTVAGTIYIGSNDGYLYAIQPDGTLLWRFLTGGWIRSSPAVAPDGTIYVGSGDGILYAIYGQGGLMPSPWPMFRCNLVHSGQAGS